MFRMVTQSVITPPNMVESSFWVDRKDWIVGVRDIELTGGIVRNSRSESSESALFMTITSSSSQPVSIYFNASADSRSDA